MLLHLSLTNLTLYYAQSKVTTEVAAEAESTADIADEATADSHCWIGAEN